MNWREWKRQNGVTNVSKSRPCQVCGKPDWCLAAIDGSFSICPRTESDHRLGEMGWVHGKMTRRVECPSHVADTRREASFPVNDVHSDLVANASIDWTDERASELGVQTDALFMLEIGQTRDGLTAFPMFDHTRRMIGIRIRDQHTGKKWAWPGSCNGMFMPAFNLYDTDVTLVVEGPTDAAAGLSLGFNTIGRASALSNFDMVKAYFDGKDTEAVIVAEIDGGVGVESATKLARHIAPVVESRVIVPKQGKDIRAWLQSGATKACVLSQINQSARIVA